MPHLPKLAEQSSFSPLIFLFALIIGLVLHTTVPWLLSADGHTILGLVSGIFFLLISAPILMWVKSARVTDPHSEQTYEDRCANIGFGPYKYSRHPRYLSYFILMVGCGLILNSATILVITAGILILFSLVIIPREEGLLRAQFGECYDDFKMKTGMWL